MHLELTHEESRFLERQLSRHLQELETELAHTDSRNLQRALADDARRMREILGRVRRHLEETAAYV